jgi:phospholipid/cholesterol/gamma-HCH transport system permease protein
MMRLLYHFGRYLLLLARLFRRWENRGIYWKEIVRQCMSIGLSTVGIIAIISTFTGAVTTVQTAYQLVAGLVPLSIIGSIVSDSSMLELAPTICNLVVAGKVGSSIASEIGSMKVNEEIDYLETMGVNSAGYVITPKIIAGLLMIPLLTILAAALSIAGGVFVGELTGILPREEFLEGARGSFKTFTVVFMMIKATTFAFIITSVSSYQGYFVTGGSVEVGEASTRGVVYSCIILLFSDYALAQIIL